jgi:anti-sigma factor RsiW
MTDMDRSIESEEIELMRLLHGELPPERARALEGRLAAEPELARAYRLLGEKWEGLELAPAAPPPLGFSVRVMAEVRSAAREGAALSWSLAPTWVRAAAAAALVGGIALGALGAGLGLLPARHHDAPPGMSAIGEGGESVPLADSYWSVFEEETASSVRSSGASGEARP